MADLKKFLDQSGVSALWTRVAEEIQAEMTRAKAAEEAAAAAAKKAQDEVGALETYIGVIPDGEDGSPIAASIIDYVDQKTEGIVSDAVLGTLQTAVNSHTDAINLLNGDAETIGSIANTVATVEANAKKYTDDEMAKFQTLSESEILAAIAAASNEA